MSVRSYSILLENKESAKQFANFINLVEKEIGEYQGTKISIGYYVGAMQAKKDIVSRVGYPIPKGSIFGNVMIDRADIHSCITDEYEMDSFGLIFQLEELFTRKRSNSNSYMVLNMRYLEGSNGETDIPISELIELFK